MRLLMRCKDTINISNAQEIITKYLVVQQNYLYKHQINSPKGFTILCIMNGFTIKNKNRYSHITKKTA